MNLIYALCMISCGISTAVVPLFSQYWILASLAGVFGFAISANYSLISPILVNLVSLEQFSSAYGFLLMIQGISNLIGPPIAGYMYDYTKVWWPTFVASGGFIALSGLMLGLWPCWKTLGSIRRNLGRNKEAGGIGGFKEESNPLNSTSNV